MGEKVVELLNQLKETIGEDLDSREVSFDVGIRFRIDYNEARVVATGFASGGKYDTSFDFEGDDPMKTLEAWVSDCIVVESNKRGVS